MVRDSNNSSPYPFGILPQGVGAQQPEETEEPRQDKILIPRNMELYSHKTAGGAEYYSTKYKEIPTGAREGTTEGIVLRTDGDELEISNYAQLKRAGFKAVILPDGTKIEL